ncbi:MAG: Glycosyl transferase, family 9 [candidate division TM6 bacterium GW2011_GWF2_38_10]|nr:MAG: Glycosyl transferase, family 9 [candidate division TM6 bacterium GW2011_GWF2_38_10]
MHLNHTIPHSTLANAKKVLFITPLTPSTFVYWHRYFMLFKQRYPQLELHVWLEKKQANKDLTTWINACPFITNVVAPQHTLVARHIAHQKAHEQNYSIIVNTDPSAALSNALRAKKINPTAELFCVGKTLRWYNIIQKKLFKHHKPQQHTITSNHTEEAINAIIQTLFADTLPGADQQHPHPIPQAWMSYAQLRFLKWEITQKQRGALGRVIFVDIFADTTCQSWPLHKLHATIAAIKQKDHWDDVTFIVYAPQHKHRAVQRFFTKHSLKKIILFSAHHNFFQLPALISLCDAIITVENVALHFAHMYNIPTIALLTAQAQPIIDHSTHPQFMLHAHKNKTSAINTTDVLNAFYSLLDLLNASCKSA